MRNKTKLLILGGTGQIGRRLIANICYNEYDVSLMSRHYPSNDELIQTLITEKGVKHITCDIQSSDEIRGISNRLTEFDVLVHLADNITSSLNVVDYATKALDLSIFGTINLLEKCTNLEHIVYTSSYLVYGNPHSLPVNEQHPTNPQRIYSIGKLAAEKTLILYSKEFRIPVTILRISSVYGPGTPENHLIPQVINRAIRDEDIFIFGNGSDSRDYIHVEDVAKALILNLKKRCNEIINIGSGVETCVRDVVDFVLKHTHSKSKIIFKDRTTPPLRIFQDISKAHDLLSFHPKYFLKKEIMNEIYRIRQRARKGAVPLHI